MVEANKHYIDRSYCWEFEANPNYGTHPRGGGGV